MLRTREDSEAIRGLFGSGRRLVVIGAGWIGLEVAAAARAHDTAVTILEAAELPLLAVLGREMGDVFADLHRDHGVDLRLGVCDRRDQRVGRPGGRRACSATAPASTPTP